MEREVEHEATKLGKAAVDVVVYGCTSGSFVLGPDWSEALARKIEKAAGTPAVTTAGAMVAALQALDVSRVALVTPYVSVTNERLITFLEHFGIRVVTLQAFEVLDQFAHASIAPEEIYSKAKSAARAGSPEGLFISCTQLKAVELVQYLEGDLGLPVATATQAALWQALSVCG
ncbi:MAG TPA: maleate cis-trans isomerase, partial [Firmicutes bacterium]|nr:maleate cis-trans isomerase [Bacillota bacterium]